MKPVEMTFGRFLWSSTGKKVLMALSGLVLIGFLVGHLLGNLQIFIGPDALNRYSAFLKSTGELLWIVRIGLLVAVGVHIWTAVALTLENRAARPDGYANKTYTKATYASRTMHWSGIIVFAYIVYHLMHFTFKSVHPQYSHFLDAHGRPDVYRMVVLSFQQPLIALTYIIANFLLATHLSHGLYSMFQSLGLQTKTLRARVKPIASIVAYLIFVGYASIPAAVWLGLVKLDPGATP